MKKLSKSDLKKVKGGTGCFPAPQPLGEVCIPG